MVELPVEFMCTAHRVKLKEEAVVPGDTQDETQSKMLERGSSSSILTRRSDRFE